MNREKEREQIEKYANTNPTRRSKNRGSFTPTDLKFLVVEFLVFWITSQRFGVYVGFLVAILLYWLFDRNKDARRYYEFAQWCASLWIRYRRRGYIWRADKARSRLGKMLLRKPAIPLAIHELGDTGVGLIHSSEGNDTLGISFTGSDIPSMEVPEASQTYERLADLYRGVAALNDKYAVGVSSVFTCSRGDLLGQYEVDGRTIHPDIVWPPDGDEAAQNLHKVWKARRQRVPEMNAHVTMANMVTIQRQGLLARVKPDESLAEDDVNRLPIIRVADETKVGLTGCTVRDPQVMNPYALHNLLAEGFQGSNIDAYRVARNEFQKKTVDMGHHQRKWAATRQWEPQSYIRVFKDGSEIDGVHHTVLEVTKLPEVTMTGFFRLLFTLEPRDYSVAVVSDVINGDLEYWALQLAIPMREAASHAAGIIYKGPRKEKKEEAQKERQREVAEDFRVHFGIYIGIAAPSKEQREIDAQKVQTRLSMRSIETRRITGERWQIPAVVTARLGIGML